MQSPLSKHSEYRKRWHGDCSAGAIKVKICCVEFESKYTSRHKYITDVALNTVYRL